MSDDVRSSINSSNEDINNTGTFNFEIEDVSVIQLSTFKLKSLVFLT